MCVCESQTLHSCRVGNFNITNSLKLFHSNVYQYSLVIALFITYKHIYVISFAKQFPSFNIFAISSQIQNKINVKQICVL